jgi:hypothetical protein
MSSSPPERIPKIPYSTQHKLPLKTLSWTTLLITLVMAALYVLLGFPVTFDSYYQIMYFHSIGIGIAALAVYLVVETFDLEAEEPKIDFPLPVRAWIAVLFAAIGGVIYLFPALNQALPDVALGLYVVAFILLADVGGALYIELMLMPRKRYGVYDASAGYYRRMFPFSKDNRQAYSHVGAAYWLAVAAVGAAFIAGLIGLVNLWVRIFGASAFAGYISYIGLDANGFIGATLDPHTHAITLAIMAGIVAIVAQRYGVLESVSGLRKNVARLGIWISFAGVIGFTIVYLAIAFANYSPPTLFASGLNGLAGDDSVMSITALGAMVLIIPLALEKVGAENKPVWKDSVRASLLGTWVFAVVLNVIAGFWVEFHEDLFQGSLLANDVAYGHFQSLVALFVLTGAALILLTVDRFKIGMTWRRIIGWGTGLGLLLVTIGGLGWSFVDPSTTGLWFDVHVIGILVIGLMGLVSVVSIYSKGVESARLNL